MQDTTGIESSTFGIEMQNKIKKFPDSENLYKITSKYLFNEFYFKILVVSFFFSLSVLFVCLRA